MVLLIILLVLQLTCKQEKITKGKTEIGELKKLIQKGFKEKRAGTKYAEESKKRIAEELDTIWGNDYLDYFLVVQDYCEYARHHAGGHGGGA